MANSSGSSAQVAWPVPAVQDSAGSPAVATQAASREANT
eukprot:CAMPEP_0195111852 /NCGR_PEP_ID=MMETSP0448-20130528/97382_1 /TAXON_ID=66468 /ORGANISM="Heterocapsa triquestra, Strain CCMP 448" /LENGTH=38 /DNA_ID= /DNA_START= /DNA_END= /DNA_ORIENTATION=